MASLCQQVSYYTLSKKLEKTKKGKKEITNMGAEQSVLMSVILII